MRASRRDLDSLGRDVRDVALDHLGGEPVGRNGEPQGAPGHGRRLEDLHAVPLARELEGGGEPRRARADDRDTPAVRLRLLDPRLESTES